jgi:1-acyl-sn-glycerol-3-phosphate acyltransferase
MRTVVKVSQSRDLPRWLAVPYAAYALTAFAVLASSALILILPVPWQPLRRRMVRRAARLALRVCGMQLVVQHIERLPGAACVVVANHSSYLDGIVLYAALPPTFGFVIKREMSRVPLANLLLRRIGAHYVDRGRSQKSTRDARKLLKQANAGGALAFFPEGTFHHVPGLMKFRSGAFRVAASAGLAIMPVAIRGTRAALPPLTLLPRPGRIEIELAPLLPPPASVGAADIAASMSAARQAILARIAEPDLATDG